jgi:hypothetical protein
MSVGLKQIYNPLTGQFNLVGSVGGGGVPVKESVSLATAAPLIANYFNGASGSGATLTNSGPLAGLIVDGVLVVSGERILVKDQIAALQNGIYTVTTVGNGATAWVLTRALDYNQPAEIQPGVLIPIAGGNTNSNTLWIEDNVVLHIGVDPINFSQFSAPAFGTINHAVLVGGPNNTVQSIGPGSSGTVFVGNTGGNPDFSNDPTVNSMTIINAPALGTDATNKAYVDLIASGFVFKNGVNAASTVPLTTLYFNGVAGVGATLTNAGAQTAFVIDTYTAAPLDRILIKDQANTFENGIYSVTNIGSGATNWVLTRTTDFDTPVEIAPGALVGVLDGNVNKSTFWDQTQTVVNVGVDAVLFTEFSSAPIHTTQFETQVGGLNNSLVSIPTGLAGDVYLSAGVAANPSFRTPTLGTGLTGTFNATTHEYGLVVPVTTAHGGTGVVSPAAHTLMVAEGAAAMNQVGPGTAGQVVVSGGALADPNYITPTTGTGLTGTFDATTHEYALVIPVTADNGGSGLISPTAHGVLIGEGALPFGVVAPDTAGKVFLAKGALTDPGFVTPTTGTGLTGTFNGTTHEYALVVPVTTPNGGTGLVSPTAHTVLIGEGVAALGMVGPGVALQVLQSGGPLGDPAYSTATYPATATSAGTLLRADGTNWTVTTSTYPNTNAINTLLYASAANVMNALATANNGLLVTSALGVPSILAGPGTTANVLQSNTAGPPSFSTATYPVSTTVNQLLYSSSANVIQGLATGIDGVLVTSHLGVPSILANGVAGQVLTANLNAPPSWQNAAGGGIVSVSGTLNRIDVTAGANPVVDISSLYVGQASITTLGTIATGTWAATAIAADHGGTGVVSPAIHTVMIAQGAAAMNQVGPGLAGQVLQSQGALSDPAYSTATYPATTAQGDLLLSTSANTIQSLVKDTNATRYLSNTGTSNNAAWAQVDVTNGVTGILPVANGGLGVANPGAHTILIGEGASPTSSFGPGSAGQIPVSGGASADPGYVTPTTGTGITGTFNATTHQYALVSPVVVGNGGTGQTSLTAYAVLCGGTNSTNPVQSIASVGVANNVLTSNGPGALPTFQAFPGGLTWSTITINQTVAPSNGYICNKAGTLVLTLPATSTAGDKFEVTGINTALGWSVAQNANQQIFFGTSSTTIGVGGSIASINTRDWAEFLCVVGGASSNWNCNCKEGNLTVV